MHWRHLAHEHTAEEEALAEAEHRMGDEEHIALSEREHAGDRQSRFTSYLSRTSTQGSPDAVAEALHDSSLAC